MKESAIIIHNVRSVFNVASIFRTAAAAGVIRVYLTGFSPGPFDRFGRKKKDFAKVSLGSEKFLNWQKGSFNSVIKRLKKENFFIIALEQATNSVDYKKIRPRQKTAIVVGNEVKGLTKKELNQCHVTAEIPLPGQKESLNVSIALAVALFRIFNI